jgi:hypothetical protein
MRHKGIRAFVITRRANCGATERTGPVLMSDAVDAYLAHVRASASPAGVRVLAWLLGYVSDLVGPYRVLVEVDEHELAEALSVLHEVAPAARAIGTRDMISAWSRWCRSAGLPAPSWPPGAGSHLHVV